MNKSILILVFAVLVLGAFQTRSIAESNFIYAGEKSALPAKYCLPADAGCQFAYDYIDVAYLYSDYGSEVAPGVLAGRILRAPNGSLVDKMKGVDVAFSKTVNDTFFLAGEFYNTDGRLTPSLVAANPLALTGVRAEFYYYRLGVGARHSISDKLDFTFETGGLYADCQVVIKLQDEWGWYISPGLRYCLGNFGEVYGNYSYENYERMANHRLDGGLLVPLKERLSAKLGGRYESAYEKTSCLAAIRFHY